MTLGVTHRGAHADGEEGRVTEIARSRISEMPRGKANSSGAVSEHQGVSRSSARRAALSQAGTP